MSDEHTICEQQIQELESRILKIAGEYDTLAASHTKLVEVIEKAISCYKQLGQGGHGETPLLLLNPEKGEQAIIMATFMPHSGADCMLNYLNSFCFDELEQALAEAKEIEND
jgi:hypothetical protein